MQQFVRINELFEKSEKCHKHNFFRCWFDNVEATQEENYYLSTLERDLLQIENAAWPDFMQKCLPLICNQDPKYHWANLWNVLNESKGYIFLKKQGFENIEFLRENNYRTPDIKALSQNGSVLLEVKNVNRSESDTFWTIFQEPRFIDDSHNFIAALCGKLGKLYGDASKQLLEYCRRTGEAAQKICFFVVDIDILHHSKMRPIIEKLINNLPVSNAIEIEHVFIERLVNRGDDSN